MLSDNVEGNLRLVIIYSGIIAGCMVADLILHGALWNDAGWSKRAQFFIEQGMIITFGIVTPLVLMILGFVGMNQQGESNIAQILGILLVIIIGILLVLGVYAQVNNIIGMFEYSYYIGYFIGMLCVVSGAMFAGIFDLITGINLIRA